jgi:hypothetical protein
VVSIAASDEPTDTETHEIVPVKIAEYVARPLVGLPSSTIQRLLRWRVAAIVSLKSLSLNCSWNTHPPADYFERADVILRTRCLAVEIVEMLSDGDVNTNLGADLEQLLRLACSWTSDKEGLVRALCSAIARSAKDMSRSLRKLTLILRIWGFSQFGSLEAVFASAARLSPHDSDGDNPLKADPSLAARCWVVALENMKQRGCYDEIIEVLLVDAPVIKGEREISSFCEKLLLIEDLPADIRIKVLIEVCILSLCSAI